MKEQAVDMTHQPAGYSRAAMVVTCMCLAGCATQAPAVTVRPPSPRETRVRPTSPLGGPHHPPLAPNPFLAGDGSPEVATVGEAAVSELVSSPYPGPSPIEARVGRMEEQLNQMEQSLQEILNALHETTPHRRPPVRSPP